MSPLDDENEVDTWAVAYAGFNMASSVHGEVLKTTEVDIGTWSFTDREFSVGGANPNAVRAITRRDATNANPVATNFLRIIGLQTWNVSAEGIAAIGVDICSTNGIIAGEMLSVTPHTNFINNICLIGVESFQFRKNTTTFQDGVYVGAGCGESEKKCIGPGNQVYDNDDFARAFDMNDDDTGGNFDVDITPKNAINVETYINAVLDLANPEGPNNFTNFSDFQAEYSVGLIDYSGYEYLSKADGKVPDYYTGAVLPETLVKYTVYNLSSCSNNGYVLPARNYANVAVIANCPITFATGVEYNLRNTLIVSMYSNPGKPAIKGAAGIDLGTADTDCLVWNEMYALGDVNFAQGGNFPNLRMLVQGSVHLAASSDSASGTNIQATEDVFIASGSNSVSTFGYCEGKGIGPKVLTAALVR